MKELNIDQEKTIAVRDKAKKELDFDFLVKIENGKFSITSLPKV